MFDKNCVTHHNACDCREAKFAEIEAENKRLREALEIVKKIYSIGYRQHQMNHKDAKEPKLCVWCEVEQALQEK